MVTVGRAVAIGSGTLVVDTASEDGTQVRVKGHFEGLAGGDLAMKLPTAALVTGNGDVIPATESHADMSASPPEFEFQFQANLSNGTTMRLAPASSKLDGATPLPENSVSIPLSVGQ
jgi:hypothetical protein